MEGNSAVLVYFTSVLYNRIAAVHPNTHRNSRLVSLTAILLPVRMSHSWAGGIVPPQRCTHQEAVNPPPSICLRLLFPTKQTTRFPMRAPGPHTASSVDMLYRRHSQMKTVKTQFLKMVCLCGGQQGLDSAQLLEQQETVCYKSACRSCLSFFWINAVIHFTDKQFSSNFILIHLLIHASKPTTQGEVEKEWELL